VDNSLPPKSRQGIYKTRLDQLLTDRARFSSREKAQSEILLGNILVNGRKETKPGKQVPSDASIEVLKTDCPYVSRGAFKLKGALEDFGLSVSGGVCCDFGASTGGFTEILLQNGAREVTCVDVGYGQLDWRLRQDPRVVVCERTNVRYLTFASFGHFFDFICGDLSFISLKWILPVASALLAENAPSIFLIKPQFELEPNKNVKGIVREPAYHIEAIERTIAIALESELIPEKLSFSHIKGTKGNVEYVILLRKGRPLEDRIGKPRLREVVNEAERFFLENAEGAKR